MIAPQALIQNEASDRNQGELQPSSLEFIPLENRPRIARLLESLSSIELGAIGGIAHLLALEIYREFQASGLYVTTQGIAFTPDTPSQAKVGSEKIVSDAQFSQTVENVFSLFRMLYDQHKTKGAILVNFLSIYLGIKIVGDQKLQNFVNRRQLLIERLQLYDMPFGLYQKDWDDIPIEGINPALFFDVRGIKSTSGIRRIREISSIFEFLTLVTEFLERIRQVDTHSCETVVKMLQNLMDRYPEDALIQDWCSHKIKEIERFISSLEMHWVNQPIYLFNNTAIVNKRAEKE